MGDVNQMIYLRHRVPQVEGPVLEVGSRDYGSTSTFRGVYAGNEYVGLDMSEGPGVDVVADLTQSTGPLPEAHFALAICCSVLEHVRQPWRFAENLTRVMRPGGQLYMAVPWVWRYHAYPDDYFRFSHRGVMSLFEAFAWTGMCFSSNVPGEFFEIGEGDTLVDSKLRIGVKAREDAERTYMPYLMVHMMGTRQA